MSNIKRFCAELEKTGADAALIASETNQRYLGGFKFTDGYILVTRKRSYLITDFRYIEAARAAVSADDFEILMPKDGMLAQINALMKADGVRSLLLEDATLPCAAHLRFSKTFEGVELLSGASEILENMREYKTEEELGIISRAQKITDAAFSHICKTITPRMTEIEVALELEFFMRRNGAEAVAFDTIAVSGKSSSMPHGVPQNKMLEPGFLTMDFGAMVDGYCSDMTRTVVIGRADAEMKRLYSTVLRAQRAALGILCEGISCFEADKCARDIINGAGYEGCFGHSLGHGVGMFIHESPRFSPTVPHDKLLRRGHVVTVEPGIYIPGKYGCRIEDMIALGHDGKIINFTKSDKELIEII